MKKVVLPLLLLPYITGAQSPDYSTGARSMALGGSSVTMSDEYASLNNSAGIAGMGHSALVFAFRNLYSIPGLNMVAAAGFIRHRNGAFLMDFLRFGSEILNEQKFGLGYSHKINFVKLGIKLSYLQYKNQLFGSTGSLIVEFGGIVHILPRLTLGGYIYNLNKAEIGQDNRYGIPAHLKFGLSYEPGENIILIAAVNKTVGEDALIRLGLEYFFINKLFIRTGLSTEPAIFYAGLGLPLRKFQIDQAVSVHPVLGVSFQFSVVYKFLQK